MEHAQDIWPRIVATAERLGVPYQTRMKWRQRQTVPHRWRLPLIQASGGTITANDFLPRDSEAA